MASTTTLSNPTPNASRLLLNILCTRHNWYNTSQSIILCGMVEKLFSNCGPEEANLNSGSENKVC
jgi:hypothetical protein